MMTVRLPERTLLDLTQAYDTLLQQMAEMANHDWDIFTFLEDLVTTLCMANSRVLVDELVEHLANQHAPDGEYILVRGFLRDFVQQVRRQLRALNPNLDVEATPYYVEETRGGTVFLKMRTPSEQAGVRLKGPWMMSETSSVLNQVWTNRVANVLEAKP